MSDDNQRKPRIPAVRVDFGKEQTLSGMHVSDDGRLTFFDETGQPVSPVFVEVDSTYGRKKGPKTLNRVVAEPSGILLDQNSSLRRYSHVFAIDTNTAEINSVRTSITVSAYVTNIDFGQPRWNATLVRQDAFEFQNAVASPERIGWSETVALIAKSNLEGLIAIIVDAHLGDLRAINDRMQAIYRNYYLPPAMELIYASADGGGVEYIANAALAHCDKIGTLLLGLSRQAPALHFRPMPPGSPFSRFRIWAAPTEDVAENWTMKPD
jgi:hypothetical protein